MDAGAAVEKIRAAGLLRTGGLIGGKWVDAYDGKTIEVQNPATGEVLANVACMGSRETSDAIASAHSTFSYIFRPFVGFREVRLVNKESRHPGGDPHVLCFVDFDNPGQATVALEALQGSF